jgi:1,2-diacylglycerol 3-beta-galactosyltransferase
MPEQCRILILTADAGLGHRSAANAVRDALKKMHGSRCAVEVSNPLDDPRTPGWLRDSQSNYDRLARQTPELYQAGYDLSDGKMVSKAIENGMRTLLYRSLRDCVDRFRPDAIVSTYPLYQAPLGAVFALTKTYIPLITVVTDLASVHRIWFSEDSDLTVVATGIVRTAALEAGLDPGSVEILGIPVDPRLAHERRPKAAIRAALGWDRETTTLLAVGSKRSGRMAELLHVLNHAGFPLQLAIVTGGDAPLHEVLMNAEWHHPTNIYNYVDNLPTLMRASDVILCKPGGLVVSEAMAAGLPMLLADAIPGQETGNADYVVNGGAGEMAGDPIHMLEIACHWFSAESTVRQTCAANAGSLGRPRAAFDTARRAWSYAQRGPQIRDTTQIVGLPRLIELFRRSKVSVEV